MKMPDDLIEMMENCGGEDLLRYLLKEDGMINWETISLYPIVAYSPPHMDEAILIGIAYWDGVHFNILHSEYEFEDHPIFDNWVKYLMEMGINYKNEAEALLDHHRAIIAIKRDIKEANKINAKYAVIIGDDEIANKNAMAQAEIEEETLNLEEEEIWK